jgi:hypothetical protein
MPAKSEGGHPVIADIQKHFAALAFTGSFAFAGDDNQLFSCRLGLRLRGAADHAALRVVADCRQ